MDLPIALTVVIVCIVSSLMLLINTLRKIRVRKEYADEAMDNISKRVFVKKDITLTDSERAVKLLGLDVEAEILLKKACKDAVLNPIKRG
ncbi:hypothetical protein [Pseudoalteromonas umbrosa]|uniref:hypothetical protein n=1 Tax=Pseudoalteromonas umbrosa TaxID=3048489 RepID=UPI0024C22A1F|nr:hypothetical protein [Pseudoalteromonas sp. B95]MDK1289810.1 hypothetical protein [Pseudoalteromonas sp. B95]